MTVETLEEKPARETSPQERRLVMRLLDYWRQLRGERELPMPDEVDATAISEMWGFCYLIDFTGGGEPTLRFVGDWHKEFHGADVTGRSVADLERNTLIERSTYYAREVEARGVPVTYGGEFEDPAGRRILYRSILLPLSNDGERPHALLGGANCRVLVSAA